MKDNAFIKKKVGFIVTAIFLYVIISFFATEDTCATKIQPDFGFKIEKEVSPWPPHLGDTLKVVFSVKSKYDLEDTRFDVFLTRGFTILSIKPIGFQVRKESSKRYWFKIKENESREFIMRVKIREDLPEDFHENLPICILDIGITSDTRKYGWGTTGAELRLFLLHREMGLLGTGAERRKGLPLIYRYDVEKRKIYPPMILDMPVDIEQNRRMIEMMRDLEPSLSDSEALQLHYDFRFIGKPKGDEFSDEKEVYRYYLAEGWLDAMRAGKRIEWINKEKFKISKAYAREYEKRTWFLRNFPLILGLVCTISLIFLIVIRTKRRRKKIK